MRDIWITNNQVKHEDAIRKATIDNCIVALLDHSGTGFKFSLSRYCQLIGGIRAAIVQINMRSKTREIGISILNQIATIKFNKKSASANVFDLIRVVGTRVKQDLKGKRVLLVFDKIHYLRTPGRLSQFLDLLDNIPFRCGIILRFEPRYVQQVLNWGDTDLFVRFEKVTFFRKVTKPNTSSEIRQMLQLHGLTDPNLLNEISLNTESFTMAKLMLGKKALFRPSMQLNIFTEQRLRV